MLENLIWWDFWTLERWKKKSVLIVEDDLFLQPLVVRAIRSVDPHLSLDWVTTEDEAIRALRKKSYCLILADCLLPQGQTGISLWNYCVRKYPKVPFLLTSGLSEQNVRKLASDADRIPPFLPKPFHADQCRGMIQSMLDEDHRISIPSP